MALTQERLKELLHYDLETGIFTWLVDRTSGTKAGAIAGSMAGRGYSRISIDGNSYFQHRLAWLYVHGYFPENTIDHINRIRNDNRFLNLREATMQCQKINCCHQTNNSSGIRGVAWHKKDKKWRCYVKINGKDKCLGNFSDKLDAAYTRYAVEQCLGFYDCNPDSSALRFIEAVNE